MDDWYIYYGRNGEIVPEDVVRVRIHTSVRAIKDEAFYNRWQLTTVILNDGLEEIGERAFTHTSLTRIDVPRSVKKIKYGAFYDCFLLTIVKLGEGLEEIGERAFWKCAISEITIPPSVKAIKKYAFHSCRQLTAVILNDGLKEIGWRAFYNCTSLREIAIPRSVKVIREEVFCCYYVLTTVIPSNIPNRLGLVRERKWHANIQDMLRRIPSISSEGWLSYFDSIHSKLSVYENLKDVPMLLELAIWKSKIIDHYDQNTAILTAEVKMQCRIDSITMVSIVVPNVLSYLTDYDC